MMDLERLSNDPFIKDNVAPQNIEGLLALLGIAAGSQRAFKRKTAEAIKKAADMGRAFNLMRDYFPPRSGWESWVERTLGLGERTVRRQRALAEYFTREDGTPHEERLALLDQANFSTGISVMYALAAQETPEGAIAEVERKLAVDGAVTNAEAQAIIRRNKQEAWLRDHAPDLYALVQSGELPVDAAHRMAHALLHQARAVRDLALKWKVINPNVYPALDRIRQEDPALFAQVFMTGHCWSGVREEDIPLRDASPTDLLLLLREENAERFLGGLTRIEAWESDEDAKAKAQHVKTVRGRRASAIAALEEMDDDDYIVIILRPEASPRPALISLTGEGG